MNTAFRRREPRINLIRHNGSPSECPACRAMWYNANEIEAHTIEDMSNAIMKAIDAQVIQEIMHPSEEQ